MKTARLIFGIITVVLFIIILFQSCAAGAVNSLTHSNDIGGTAGFIVAFLSLIAGIIAIATRSSASGVLTAGGFYVVSGLIGIKNAQVYTDLEIWGILFLAGGVFFVYSGIRQRMTERAASHHTQS